MKKRRHHYVWRHYLRAWAENDSIWCCRDGKNFKSNLMNIGQIKDFYKLKKLSAMDIEFIHKLAIEPSQHHLQELNKRWINSFDLVFQMKNLVESKGVNDPEINNLLDEAIYNFEEDLHSGIESDAIKYIESILNEDVGFYKTEQGCMNFTSYICIQYMRTQKIRTNVLANVSGMDFIDTDKIWNVLSHIFATNMAWSLYADRQSFNMVLLKNQTTEELITGDQPVINTHATGLVSTEAPVNIEFYYPVSPKLAILITEEDNYNCVNEITLSICEIEKYNQSMVEQSHSQIYATSEEVLNTYAN